MTAYVTGNLIKRLREKKGLTQAELGEKLGVGDKAVSKWETGKGYPDIALLEPLSRYLGVSVIELLSGKDVTNVNRCGNVLRTKFYVCPLCGNVMTSLGEAVIGCCGITLPSLPMEECDAEHTPSVESVEDEYYVTFPHEMTKEHYLSFVAGITFSGVTLVKLYAEGNAEVRFKRSGLKLLCFYCNKHGLFRYKI